MIFAIAGEGALASNGGGIGGFDGASEVWFAAPPSRARISGGRPPGKPD
jgi:hypothetical protein